MSFSISTQDIGMVFYMLGLHPYIKGINRFGIHRGGDDYEVLTERLD